MQATVPTSSSRRTQAGAMGNFIVVLADELKRGGEHDVFQSGGVDSSSPW